ncbi:uncharacterized protein [Euphorbia lathyris]|uniref:uncharacterized protein n=1 Tax=Euphorbia lathyris TaxID=212925 RepID=UPI0033138427
MRSICDTWRVYKSRIKKKHYKAYDNDDARRENRPNFLSDKEFETLLKFWNDVKVKKLAALNSTHRKLIKDQHTCGPIGFARIRNKLQLEKPDQVEPSLAELFLATRKRKEGRKYKDEDSATHNKLARIEEKLSSGGKNNEIIEEILGEAPSHGPSWLVGGRVHIKKKNHIGESSVATSKKKISDEDIEKIKADVREEMRSEVKEEMEKNIQAHLGTILQRLCQMNPTLNLNLDGVVVSPDTIDNPSNSC